MSNNEDFQAINQVSSDKPSDNEDFQAINEVSSDKINQKQHAVEKKLLAVFEDNQEHTISELAEIVKLSKPRTRAIVSSLVAKGKITIKGANKNRSYRLQPKR